jgi:hypothetical protein
MGTHMVQKTGLLEYANIKIFSRSLPLLLEMKKNFGYE